MSRPPIQSLDFTQNGPILVPLSTRRKEDLHDSLFDIVRNQIPGEDRYCSETGSEDRYSSVVEETETGKEDIPGTPM